MNLILISMMMCPNLDAKIDSCKPPLIRSVVLDDSQYVCGTKHSSKYLPLLTIGIGRVVVMKESLSKKAPKLILTPPIMSAWYLSSHAPVQWQLNLEALYASSFWPIKPNAGSRNGQITKMPIKLLEQFQYQIIEDRYLSPNNYPRPSTVVLSPYNDEFDYLQMKMQSTEVFFDFQINGKNVVDLYVLANDQLSLFRYDADKDTWSQGKIIDLKLKEPFHLVKTGEVMYIVSQAGKLFEFTEDVTGKGKLDEVGGVPREPILAIVANANTKRTFAFTKNHAFEICRAIKIHHHSIRIIHGYLLEDYLKISKNCHEYAIKFLLR
jgi:hypothetical protein